MTWIESASISVVGTTIDPQRDDDEHRASQSRARGAVVRRARRREGAGAVRAAGLLRIHAAGLHPGQTATVSRDGDVIGTLGALHPAIAREHKLTTTLYLFELSLDALERGEVPRFGSLSRFPAVRRDISIIVDDAVTAQAVRKSVGQSSTDVLKNLELFDVYRGEGIDSGRKSLSLGLTFQADSRTLLDDEIDAAVEAIVSALTGDIGATLRG